MNWKQAVAPREVADTPEILFSTHLRMHLIPNIGVIQYKHNLGEKRIDFQWRIFTAVTVAWNDHLMENTESAGEVPVTLFS